MRWLGSLFTNRNVKEATRFPAGRAAWNKYVCDTLAELSALHSPGWTLLLCERRLPHGAVRWIRVDATETGIQRTLVSLRFPGPARGQTVPPASETAAGNAAADSGPALLALIKAAVAQGLLHASVQSGRDGHLCDLVAIEAGTTRLSVDVLLSPEQPGRDPIACLCRTIVDLADGIG
jgi:hypothetical protein